MKKTFLAAALALGTGLSAHAADASAPFHFLLGAGLTFGGDTLVTVPFTDGSSDDIKAGGLVHLYGGGEYRFGDLFALQATVGYHINDTRAASNGSVRFTRVPVDVLGLFSLNEKFRLGAGAQFVSGAELKGSGVASNVSQKYDSTTGAIVEGEYLLNSHIGFKLRYVSEKFKPENAARRSTAATSG